MQTYAKSKNMSMHITKKPKGTKARECIHAWGELHHLCTLLFFLLAQWLSKATT